MEVQRTKKKKQKKKTQIQEEMHRLCPMGHSQASNICVIGVTYLRHMFTSPKK